MLDLVPLARTRRKVTTVITKPVRLARRCSIPTSTIQRGLRELPADEPLAGGRTRRAGSAAASARSISTRPSCCAIWMRWSSRPPPAAIPTRRCGGRARALRTLAVALDGLGHRVSHTVVAELSVHNSDHRGLTAVQTVNAKTREGRQHVDRDAQFRYIARRVRRAQRAAADDFGGHQEEGAGRRVQERGPHLAPGEDAAAGTGRDDFVIPATATTGGKAIPYGIYDLHRNEGWVRVGIDHDTASFAVRSIQRWWQHMGRPAYRQAQSLLITADAGGSNGARLRLWKWELQRLANRTGSGDHGLSLSAGYEQVEQDRASVVLAHRDELARHPTRRLGHDRPSLIGSTHSRSGLRVRSELDRGQYPGGITVTDAQLATVRLERHRFHPATGTTRSIPLLREHKSQ